MFFKYLLQRKRFIFITSFLLSLGGLLLCNAFPEKWSAQGSFSVPMIDGKELESSNAFLNRFTRRSLSKDIIKETGFTLVYATNLIEFRLYGRSVDEARNKASKLLATLSLDNEALINDYLDYNRRQLDDLLVHLDRVKEKEMEMDYILHKSNNKQLKLDSVALYLDMANDFSKSLEQKRAYERAISKYNTHNVELVGQILVSEKPVFPNRLNFWFFGLLLGFLVSISTLFLSYHSGASRVEG